MTSKQLKTEIRKMADKKQALVLARFFKTGPGEYGEGDKFLGLTVPQQRQVAKKYAQLNSADLAELLLSPWHEFRLVALLILIEQYRRADAKGQERIFKFYLKYRHRINNWDLVDLSCYHIIGHYVLANPAKKDILYKLAESKSLWDRRLAIISTLALIRDNKLSDTLNIAKILLQDEHDLIHKAVGWMLRELGKRDLKTERRFLDKWGTSMPRTMLRYAIEKFPEELRQYYLQKKI